jgi:integrase
MAKSTVRITKATVDALQPKTRSDGAPMDAYLWDGELKGFGCKCTAKGHKAFLVIYRMGGRGTKKETVTLGALGDITPDQARKLAKGVLGKVAEGVNPAGNRRQLREKEKTPRLTFAELMELYLEKNGADKRSWPETRRALEHDARPRWGTRAAESITTADVMALIDDVQARAPVMAKNLFSALRPLFAWAAPRGYITANPVIGVSSPPPPKSRKRVLDDKEIRAFWKCCEMLDYPFGPCFRLMLLTAQRETEVGGMERAELDRGSMFWRIPAARIKKDREHLVDVSPQATLILTTLPKMDCDNGRSFMFTTTGRSPISGWSNAKERLDALMRAELGGDVWKKFLEAGGEYGPAGKSSDDALRRSDKAAQALGYDSAERLALHILKPWRLHDLRRTAATGMAGLGFPPHVVDRVLNHVSGSQGGLTGVYQQFEYREERKEALLSWGVRVEQILGDAVSD